MFSACKNTTIEVQSNSISEEKISEVVTASENTETSEEDVVEVAEESPYKHIPEELLDENGIYHPEEVTADMLRERFADVDRFLSERGYLEDFGKEIKSFIMRANYSYITDATFQEIMKENNYLQRSLRIYPSIWMDLTYMTKLISAYQLPWRSCLSILEKIIMDQEQADHHTI